METSKDNILNIFDYSDGSRALGPGLRCIIWVQGCPFNCVGCTSPEGRSMKDNILIEVDKLAENIINNKAIQGITISGGEPFRQAAQLVKLIKRINKPELDLIIYTGYTVDKLNWQAAKDLLALTDVLIDGQYVDELNDNKGLRGSSNQKIHFLTERLKQYKDLFENGTRNVEVIVSDSYKKIIGVPNKIINELI
ncbi:anaerobic ribonucleoside-triphosphate reductase-activating protein [Bacteroidia bacterium]|nr:anaerobic ribonucleoside-triphosphate reductase-activating protein [Bacteroidia bacterium]